MSEFSSIHEQVLVNRFLDIHRRMEKLEALLAHSLRTSAFSENVNDISPTEAKVVQDYFSRIRDTMLACLQENKIPLEFHRVSLRWALQTGIEFLHIAVAELGPKHLRGYGAINTPARESLEKIQRELKRLMDHVSAYLRQGLGRDLSQRLDRLEASPGTVEMLTLLNRIVTRWQLVEFRPLLDTILQRLEHPQYEIAVFGRVNSGKSSLLNHIVRVDVLPVGVTPITSVPTRLVRGDRTFARIQFAERNPQQIKFNEISQYASEEGNPNNEKHVTGITVYVTYSRLQEGVVLVDTPGIGSLALAGGTETLAYLPRCDLGVLLIDAATALNQDDLAVLQALYEAGIPAQVLVSKADLLSMTDRDRTRHYVQQQIQRELNLELPVHPVSTIGPHEFLLTRWFEREIEPLFQRHRTLAEKSLERKIAHVRESVTAVLQIIASRQGKSGIEIRSDSNVRSAEQLLSQADSAVLRAKEQCQDWSSEIDPLVENILRDAAQGLSRSSAISEPANEDLVVRALQEVLLQRTKTARQTVNELQETLKRSLETIEELTVLSGVDTAPIRDFICSQLPILVLSGLRPKCQIVVPWWRTLLPRWAISFFRRWLKKQLESPIREFVKGYNDQLGTWLKDKVAQLEDIYQSQAEVLHEQVQRITAKDAPGCGVENIKDLLHDIQELQKSGVTTMVSAIPS
jgi:GTP-binding protein EngB required for normal cell division